MDQEARHNADFLARLERELQQARQRNMELERQLEALELDSQRVHRLLDEFGVPRYVDATETLPSDGRRERQRELSLFGRVNLILEEEEEDQ